MSSFFPEDACSLVKKHLSLNLHTALEHLKTDSGYTLAKAIHSGIKNPDSSIGIYAGDAQSYQTFSKIFDPIISDYHGFKKGQKHASDITELDLAVIDPQKKYIKSTRIRVARNLKGFCFPAHILLPHRRELEKKIKNALSQLKGDLSGNYFPFESLDEKQFQQLKTEPLCFEKGDRFQDAAGINSDFPKCRGVFHSFDKQFVVWVNEEDHLRIISLEKTSDISSVFNRLCRALLALNRHLDFAQDKRYGYLTSCPTNIGTGMRAGVHIHLEKLEQKKELLYDIAKGFHLQIRGTFGEKTKVENAVFDISNCQRLGISESKIVKNLHAGLLAIIAAEKSL
ncbi:MAG: arginine kinase [Proteobacteria bacterium]|nr:arginine kinase [Pseudomonadota bacterium]MBU1586002.1 arginine kinase [Pseudomonadota bacterium]MBU2454062.1 arginine kinase [Pseudomonadota bacterium]MBU2630085.1 arginine kinase [Pseudomonadota bacterium]